MNLLRKLKQLMATVFVGATLFTPFSQTWANPAAEAASKIASRLLRKLRPMVQPARMGGRAQQSELARALQAEDIRILEQIQADTRLASRNPIDLRGYIAHLHRLEAVHGANMSARELTLLTQLRGAIHETLSTGTHGMLRDAFMQMRSPRAMTAAESGALTEIRRVAGQTGSIRLPWVHQAVHPTGNPMRRYEAVIRAADGTDATVSVLVPGRITTTGWVPDRAVWLRSEELMGRGGLVRLDLTAMEEISAGAMQLTYSGSRGIRIEIHGRTMPSSADGALAGNFYRAEEITLK